MMWIKTKSKKIKLNKRILKSKILSLRQISWKKSYKGWSKLLLKPVLRSTNYKSKMSFSWTVQITKENRPINYQMFQITSIKMRKLRANGKQALYLRTFWMFLTTWNRRPAYKSKIFKMNQNNYRRIVNL